MNSRRASGLRAIRPLLDKTPDEQQAALEEQRRLLFVGLTREPCAFRARPRRLNGLYKKERRPGYRYLGHAGHSVASLALPSAIVCHCMFHGASAPPRFSGMT
jgi:hypothetical protein